MAYHNERRTDRATREFLVHSIKYFETLAQITVGDGGDEAKKANIMAKQGALSALMGIKSARAGSEGGARA